MIIGSNLVFSVWDGAHRQLGRMDHSPEEERDFGNKPGEANLTAVNGGPLVHQPLSTNDGGGEVQYQLLRKLFKINKVASESTTQRLRSRLQMYVLWDLQSIVWFFFLQSKWGQCSVTLMDISPALTGLPQTHKPVTAASVNHYPATLYLVHICRFTGLWNVFSVELGPNQIEMWSSFLRAQHNNIITSDKWQSAGADAKMRSCVQIQLLD